MRSSRTSNAGAAVAERILQVSKKLRRYPALGYAAAFLSIGAATLVQWLLASQFAGSPFLLIYPAVIGTTLIGGLGPGFVAGLLAGLSQWALFIPNAHPLAIATYAFDATICVMLIDFINRTFDLLVDSIDQEKQAKQHQYFVAKELHHRIQNLFTVIQAVIRFSLPGDGLVRETVVRQRLLDRLQSMSATNQAITDSLGGGVHLGDLIGSEIRGFESRFDIGGAPVLVLSAQMTQDFSLILHELVVNALKYGALSVPEGRVVLHLDWNAPTLTVVWEERGGPQVTPPADSGFGSRILGAFAKSFCQDVHISYAPTGFRYVLEIRSDHIKAIESSVPAHRPQHAAAAPVAVRPAAQAGATVPHQNIEIPLAAVPPQPPAVEARDG